MLLTRTGIDEGIIINAAGSNCTEFPDGLPNRMVGSFYYDFAALTSVSPYYTNELAWVISDGRVMSRDVGDQSLSLLDSYDPDEEVDSPKSDGGADRIGLDRTGYSTTVSSLTVKLRLGNPQYDNVQVYETLSDEDNDTPWEAQANGYLKPFQDETDLWEWLDATTTSAGEPLDINLYWKYRQYLRHSLHWALYKVPLARAYGEAMNDDLEQADFGPGGGASEMGEPVEVMAGVPDIGPSGLIYGLGGGTDFGTTTNSYEWPETSWVRLWEPSLNAPVKFIRRGDIGNIPYSMFNSTSAEDAPDAMYEFDGFEAEQAFDSLGEIRPAPDNTTGFGREIGISIKLTGLNIHVGPDEMLVFHLQAGRARLRAPSKGTGAGGATWTPGLIIASGEPAMGPNFTLHYQEVHATARNHLLR